MIETMVFPQKERTHFLGIKKDILCVWRERCRSELAGLHRRADRRTLARSGNRVHEQFFFTTISSETFLVGLLNCPVMDDLSGVRIESIHMIFPKGTFKVVRVEDWTDGEDGMPLFHEMVFPQF